MVQTRSKKAPAKKSVAKKAPAKKAAAKQPAAKAAPVKEALTKTALVNLIAETNGVTRDVAKGVLATIEAAMTGSIHPRGVGEFTLPGLLKISCARCPRARPVRSSAIPRPAKWCRAQPSRQACASRSARSRSRKPPRSDGTGRRAHLADLCLSPPRRIGLTPDAAFCCAGAAAFQTARREAMPRGQ